MSIATVTLVWEVALDWTSLGGYYLRMPGKVVALLCFGFHRLR